MNGPKLWSSILWTLPNNVTEAVVSGGCIRDWMLGVPQKDIDVFIKTRGPNLDFTNQPRWTFGEPEAPEHRTAYEGMNNIVQIHDMLFDNESVQLIELTPDTNTETYIANFDITLCMGQFRTTHNGGLRIPPAMARDLEDKKIFCEGQTDQTSVRARRFLDKISQYEQGWVIENDPVHEDFGV